MKTVTPGYYKKFKCIGSACLHNCCIGWEIDIDPDTMEKYEKAEGVFKKRFDTSIDKSGECPRFILGKGERCPFLNESNLCDIISNLGEGYLCDICDAHPRFKNFFSDRVEIGLGLCCEEACRIILSDNEPFSLEITENTDPCGDISDYEAELIANRDWMIFTITDKSHPLADKIKDILTLKLPERTLDKWAEFLATLEIMSGEWTALLVKAAEYGVPLTYKGYESEAERLMTYFLYRYIANENYDGKTDTVIAFSVLCSQIITTLWSVFAKNTEDKIEICRLFSQEIEYSEDNVEAILDMIEDYNEQ